MEQNHVHDPARRSCPLDVAFQLVLQRKLTNGILNAPFAARTMPAVSHSVTLYG